MPEIVVRSHFQAPIERVFEAVSDHEQFLSGDGTRTKVITEGVPERNGLGCFREVRPSPLVRFVEEVVAWEPPRRYGYMIRETTLPLRHHGGELVLTAEGDGTEVVWTTRFDVTIPLLGGALGRGMGWVLARAFKGFLKGVEARLQ